MDIDIDIATILRLAWASPAPHRGLTRCSCCWINLVAERGHPG